MKPVQLQIGLHTNPCYCLHETGMTSDRSPYKSLLQFTWDWYELRPVQLQIGLHTNPCYSLHETGMNSDRYNFRSVSIQILVTVYMRPVRKSTSDRFDCFWELNCHEWVSLKWDRFNSFSHIANWLGLVWDFSLFPTSLALSVFFSLDKSMQHLKLSHIQ